MIPNIGPYSKVSDITSESADKLIFLPGSVKFLASVDDPRAINRIKTIIDTIEERGAIRHVDYLLIHDSDSKRIYLHTNDEWWCAGEDDQLLL